MKYTEKEFWGKIKKNTDHRLYCGFTEKITSKKVRTQDEKNICDFIIHTIYLLSPSSKQ